MDLATFRATSKPRKLEATYRPLTTEETTSYLNGEHLGEVANAAYLRMCVAGADNAADGMYLIGA